MIAIILAFILFAIVVVLIIIILLNRKGITSDEPYTYEKAVNNAILCDERAKLTGFEHNLNAGEQQVAGYPDKIEFYLYPHNGRSNTDGFWAETNPLEEKCLLVRLDKSKVKRGLESSDKVRVDHVIYDDENEKIKRLSVENMEYKKMVNSLNLLLNRARLAIANEGHSKYKTKLFKDIWNIVNKREERDTVPQKEKGE